MKARYKTWVLWCFMTNEGFVTTRGRSIEEARLFLESVIRLKILEDLPHCPIDAAYRYSQKHPYDWLRLTPHWQDPERDFVPDDVLFKRQFFSYEKC